MFKLALSGTSPKFFERYDLRGLCRFLKSVGVTNLELVDPNCPLKEGAKRTMGCWSLVDVAAAKAIMEEEGCKSPVLQFRFGMNAELSGDVAMHISEFKACIDAAVELGAGTVLHYLSYSAFKDLDMDLVHKYLDEPLAYAKTKGVKLVLENEFENPATESPEKMLRIMWDFDDPFFLTNFDAPNYEVHGDEGYPYAYNLLKDYIGYVHLKNVCHYVEGFYDDGYTFGEAERDEILYMTGGPYKGAPAAFLPSFEGQVNTFGLLRRLEEDGYDGYLTFEPHADLDLAIRDIKNDLKLLRKYGFV